MDYYKLKVLNNKKIFIWIFILIILAIGLLYYFTYKKEDDDIIMNIDSDNQGSLENYSDSIYVDIKGYIEKPGVYSFKQSDNARVNDLIIKAGGLKKEADTSLLNLSKKLEDEMAIIIYSKKEISDYLNGKNELQEKLLICEEKLKNNACIKQEKTSTSLININEASKEELMTLQGIGEAKANAIIKYRSNNPFKKIEDLLNVDGIGEGLFESIKKDIKV